MAKNKPIFTIESYGLYTKWDKTSKNLPKIKKFTSEITAVPNTEFGLILHIKKGKGKILEFCIKHPPFKDEIGNVMSDFTGDFFIRNNDYRFFIGDMVWEPVDDKKGEWIVQVFYEDEKIAEKIFLIN